MVVVGDNIDCGWCRLLLLLLLYHLERKLPIAAAAAADVTVAASSDIPHQSTINNWNQPILLLYSLFGSFYIHSHSLVFGRHLENPSSRGDNKYYYRT